MYYFSDSTTSSLPENPLRQLAQLTVQIQAAAQDLLGYEIFFGEENIAYVLAGSASMMACIQDLMGREDGEALLGCRDIRHDLRNKLAVVKGFSDLMKMDLPESHSAGGMLDRLSGRCTNFVSILDSVKLETKPSGEEFRLAG